MEVIESGKSEVEGRWSEWCCNGREVGELAAFEDSGRLRRNSLAYTPTSFAVTLIMLRDGDLVAEEHEVRRFVL